MAILGNILRKPARLHRRARGSAGRGTLAALAFGLALLLAGCAAPQTGSQAADTASARADAAAPALAVAVDGSPSGAPASPPRSKPAPPMSDPLPAQRAPDAVPAPAPAATAPQLDLSCRSDADCVVKDVGNCCGYYPRCVNVNARVDPQAVQAQCARSGMASVCGFKSVEGCACVKGECRDQQMPLDVQ